MKAIIIVLAGLMLAVVLKVVEIMVDSKRIKSVGAKSNNKSMNIPTIDLNDPESVKAGLEHYKGLED